MVGWCGRGEPELRALREKDGGQVGANVRAVKKVPFQGVVAKASFSLEPGRKQGRFNGTQAAEPKENWAAGPASLGLLL